MVHFDVTITGEQYRDDNLRLQLENDVKQMVARNNGELVSAEWIDISSFGDVAHSKYRYVGMYKEVNNAVQP